MPRSFIPGVVRFALLFAALQAVCVPAPLTAQYVGLAASPPPVDTDGLFPGPVRTKALHRTLRAAGASAGQIIAATDALEAHHQAYHDLHEEVLLPCLLEHAAMTWAFNARTLPARHEWPRLQQKIASARTEIQGIDDALFANLEAILAEQQHAALLMLRERRQRDALAIRIPALLSLHHLLDPDLEAALTAAAPQEEARLRSHVFSVMQVFSSHAPDAVASMVRAAPPGSFEAAIDRAEELELLKDHPVTLDDMTFATLRTAMLDAAKAQRAQRAAAFGDLSALVVSAAETIAAQLPDDAARRFLNRVHELRHPQLRGTIFASASEVDRLIDHESDRRAQVQDAPSDLLDLLVQARDRLAPITQRAVRAADELTAAGDDQAAALQQRLYRELPLEMSSVMTDLNDAYIAATGSPLPAPPTKPQPPSEPRDEPFAAALGAERMADLPNDAFRSLDWALPPPIRTIHATRWSRLLGLSAEDAQHLSSMIAAHRSQSIEQPAHRALQGMARRMELPLGPTEGQANNLLTAKDLPDLARARRAAIANMIAMDASFFADLLVWLDSDEMDDIVHMLEADRHRELSTTQALIVTGRRRSISHAWRTSPVMLLARVEGVKPDTLHEALRAADRHILDITEHARQYLDHRIIVAQGDDELFLHHRRGDPIDEEARNARIAAPLAQKHAARRALRHSLRAALDAMCDALPDPAAMDLMNQFRREAYPFLFASMSDISPVLHAALQSAGPTDPKRDALTDLIIAWREQSERLNEAMIDLIEQSEEGATAPVRSTDESNERLEEFGLRRSVVFHQMLRSECDDRALLKLDAIAGE